MSIDGTRIIKQLTQLQEKISEAKLAAAQTEGELKQLTKQLKEEFKIADADEALKELERLANEKVTLMDQIETDFEKFKKDYDI